MNECPQCGSIKSWHFSPGEPAASIFDRFDKVSPDQGWCNKCGFSYSEHIRHPLEEQIREFREGRLNEKKKNTII